MQQMRLVTKNKYKNLACTPIHKVVWSKISSLLL